MLPFRYRVITPFLSDVDTSLTGDVFYRETRDPSLLRLAQSVIDEHFPLEVFDAQSLFVVTWSDVGRYKKQVDQVRVSSGFKLLPITSRKLVNSVFVGFFPSR